MRLSVVIPTYRRPVPLERCLDSVMSQRRRPDEVIVVFYEADQQTADVVAARRGGCPSLRSTAVATRSVLAAMDAGASVAHGDILAFTDDDACPRSEWTSRLVVPYADPAVGAVGGRDVIHQHGRVEEGVAAEVGVVRWFGRTIGNHHIGHGRSREVDVLKGVNFSLRRTLWGVDHRLRGLGAEPHWELELSLRLRSQGWRLVYDPEAVVDHYVAPRIDETQRGDAGLKYVEASAHNETYALLRWSPSWRRPLVVLYSVLVGSRLAPGLAAAANRWLRGQGRDRLGHDLAAALRGRRAGIGSYLGSSR